MRGIFKVFLLFVLLFCGVLVLIRKSYHLSWRESLEVVDQFVEDLLS